MDYSKIPQITLHNIKRETYESSLAEAEKQISAYKSIARIGVSNTMKQRFNISGDCFQIFDKRAGGVLFKDWEWELIPDNNSLKQLFGIKMNELNIYCLESDEGRILRGADTYYYFLTNKSKTQNTTSDMVRAWAKNNGTFIKDAIAALVQIKNLDCNDRRLILGVLDNVRNISLLMLNANIVKNAMNQNVVLEFSKQNDQNLSNWTRLCQAITKNMKILCFSENIDNCVEEISNILNEVSINLFDDVKQITSNPGLINLDKAFRSYREIDNFIENYIAMLYAIERIKDHQPQVLNRQINFIGAAYGGLELPFVANEILNNETLISTIVLQGKYKDRKAENYLSQVVSVQSEHNLQQSFNILGDDNILTGKTLQAMVNLLFSNDIAVDNIAIVRYPSLNRINQMILEDSAIDVSKFFNYIQGLVFSSPYTKMETKYNDQYLDALGIFNKDRRRLLEYLYKNGKYKESSEVAEIGQMYEKGC